MNTAVPASILAFVTTLHLAMVVLRAHRSVGAAAANLVTGVSVLFAASPWMMPSPMGVVAGVAAQVAWFLTCERLLVTRPTVAVAVSHSRPTTTRPAPREPSVLPTPGPAPAIPQPLAFHQVPVLATFDETPDIRTFRMARPEGFEFIAGQFLTLRVRADGREYVRCYSISSSPGARGYLEISVKRLGLVSGTLHATVRAGSTLSIKSPAGAFRYPCNDDRPLVLIAGGVGITPLMSMLRHALESEPMRPVTLLYSVRTARDMAFDDELQFLKKRHRQFRPFMAVTEPPMREDCYPGFITEELIRAAVPELLHSACFVCGPPPMMKAMTALLESLGVPKTQIYFEVFEAAIAASATPPAALPQTGLAAATAVAPAVSTSTARFERSGVSGPVAPTDTLLEAGEACGASIPSLCRAGVCGTCRTRVVEGDVRCASHVLGDDDRAEGYVLPCVSHAHTDCVVDA